MQRKVDNYGIRPFFKIEHTTLLGGNFFLPIFTEILCLRDHRPFTNKFLKRSGPVNLEILSHSKGLVFYASLLHVVAQLGVT